MTIYSTFGILSYIIVKVKKVERPYEKLILTKITKVLYPYKQYRARSPHRGLGMTRGRAITFICQDKAGLPARIFGRFPYHLRTITSQCVFNIGAIE